MLEKIYTSRLTKKEVDTLLLLQVQDDFGTVLNVHWKEIVSTVKMASQSFYNAIYGLESKGFIKLSYDCPASGERNFRGFHTIQILTPSAADVMNENDSSNSETLPMSSNQTVSVTKLENYIKETGPAYINLRDYSLVNTNTFHKLPPNVKKDNFTLYYDIKLSLEGAAKLLGFNWEHGRKGAVVRRKIKRYFDAIIDSGLIPVTLDADQTLYWSLDDITKQLPQLSIHKDIPESGADSITDICNRRIMDLLTNPTQTALKVVQYTSRGRF